MNTIMKKENHGVCRFCKAPLTQTFIDLGVSPLANSYVALPDKHKMDAFYPLHVYVCEKCFLVQLMEYESPQNIFSNYAYFSSFSSSWLAHAKEYAGYTVKRFNLNENSLVVEIASNDGYLLQYFKENGIKILGIEPAANIAEAAIKKGIPTEIDFFTTSKSEEMIKRNIRADLIAANNVLAHVPDINDFVNAFRILLAEDGVISFEFPHILELIKNMQFDTIYHEHFSYLSLMVTCSIMKAHKMRVFDVQKLQTHGGSLRVFVCHENAKHRTEAALDNILKEEERASLNSIEGYAGFSPKIKGLKRNILSFLIDAKNQNKTLAAYGAPAKGNTLLNYCGIRTDFIDFAVDKSPQKQGTLLPGSRIPVLEPSVIFEQKPDYLIIMPWNLKDEISEEMKNVKDFGCRFVTLVPKIEVF